MLLQRATDPRAGVLAESYGRTGAHGSALVVTALVTALVTTLVTTLVMALVTTLVTSGVTRARGPAP